jgi:polar amino acid transport system permease protein
MRQFSLNDLSFILLATRWTVLLSLLAFTLGGALGGAIAVLRISDLAPSGLERPSISNCFRARRC